MTITPAQARTIARENMDKHGLTDWKYTLDNAVTRAGQCRHRSKIIGMSRKVIDVMTMDEFMNTLTHEIAHALVGPGHAHDDVWRRMHLSLGGNGRTTSEIGVKVIHKWLGTCPNGHTVRRHRLTQFARNGSCPKCHPRFNPDYRFQWTEQTRIG